MKIKKIKLINYRNYDNLELNFNDSLNIIIGNNAQGKTNILESIYVLAVTKSFLSNNDKEMIKFDRISLLYQDFWRVIKKLIIYRLHLVVMVKM